MVSKKTLNLNPVTLLLQKKTLESKRIISKRVIITRIEKRRPHLYTGITDEVSFLLDSFTMFLNLFCPW